MKNLTKITLFTSGLVLIFGLVGIVSAQTTTPATSTALSKAIAKADEAIDKRVTALTEMLTKVQAMKKVSDAEKSNIATLVNNEIANLNGLKAKIDADTDKDTLAEDTKSITGGMRIFALVIPQGLIMVAADRISVIADSLTAIAAKLQVRLTEAEAAGKDIKTLQASLDDLTAKVADAKTQAAAAISYVSGLVPDQGDKTKLAANTEALKKARADIRVGVQDIKAAQKDAKAVIKGLRAFKLTATTTASSTVSQ